jgi:hypothetical protein
MYLGSVWLALYRESQKTGKLFILLAITKNAKETAERAYMIMSPLL